MEAALFLLNSIVMVFVVVMSLRDERRPTGVPQTSVFRTVEDDVVRPDNAADQALLDRTARSHLQ